MIINGHSVILTEIKVNILNCKTYFKSLDKNIKNYIITFSLCFR